MFKVEAGADGHVEAEELPVQEEPPHNLKQHNIVLQLGIFLRDCACFTNLLLPTLIYCSWDDQCACAASCARADREV